MKLFKILTPKIILYLILILTAFTYYSFVGVDAENETDFLITLIVIAILCVFAIHDIKDKIKFLKGQKDSL